MNEKWKDFGIRKEENSLLVEDSEGGSLHTLKDPPKCVFYVMLYNMLILNSLQYLAQN